MFYPGPADALRPLASTLNYRSNKTRANSSLLTLGPDGTVNVYNGGASAVHFIIDVSAYFR
ncbi:MAG: hypothetical protein ACTHQM_23880 [Thermoanaerobaculia bacterium]